jgi:hypothetical protein
MPLFVGRLSQRTIEEDWTCHLPRHLADQQHSQDTQAEGIAPRPAARMGNTRVRSKTFRTMHPTARQCMLQARLQAEAVRTPFRPHPADVAAGSSKPRVPSTGGSSSSVTLSPVRRTPSRGASFAPNADGGSAIASGSRRRLLFGEADRAKAAMPRVAPQGPLGMEELLLSKKRHYFIISNSGRPIYSRHGNAHQAAGIAATIFGLVSMSQAYIGMHLMLPIMSPALGLYHLISAQEVAHPVPENNALCSSIVPLCGVILSTTHHVDCRCCLLYGQKATNRPT